MSRVLIVGRPNVGKSTLFNRLTRTRDALIDDREGVTRDWIEGTWRLPGDREVAIRDLCGFRRDEPDPVLAMSQAELRPQWQKAELVLFVVDARAGVTASDRWLADELRQADVPVLLLANKAEGDANELAALEAAELGWDPLPVSAAHGLGIDDLEDAVAAILEASQTRPEAPAPQVRIAIVGRPNAGKSTLLNRLLREDRALVSEIAGTTRDPVSAPGMLGDIPVEYVDTAGVRRRKNIDDQLEWAAVQRSMRAVDQADVVFYLMRADEGPTQQDQVLLQQIATKGKGFILIWSQWDRIEDSEYQLRELKRLRDLRIGFLDYAPAVTMSAETGHNLGRLVHWTRKLVAQLDREIPTGQLNRIVAELFRQNPPPAMQLRKTRRYKKRRELKILYAVQTGRRPLRIRLFTNLPGIELPAPYRRYLERRLRDRLEVPDIPLVLELRGREEDPRTPARPRRKTARRR